jgi:glutathione S-transferase
MFLAEKGIEIPSIEVDVPHGEQRKAAFLAKNPFGQVPVLELADGACLSESIAICRYLDEIHPTPRLFGTTARGRAEIDMWQRRAEFGGFIPAVELGHHSSPFFRETVEQVPAWASHCKAQLIRTWQILDSELSGREYVAPSGFSVADITAFVGAEVAALWGVAIPRELEHVGAWHTRVGQRPSAAVARYDHSES